MIYTVSVRKIGKVGLKKAQARRLWFKLNPPTHEGWYFCYICHRPLKHPELDHIKSAGRHPELRYEISNLAPICHKDNQAKGSLSLEQYREKLNA